jgi:RecA/RadA recombinase
MSILATRFREEASKLKDYKMKVETEFNVGYSSGFLNFDFLNGTIVHVKTEDKDFSYYSYGLTDGSMVMIIGRSGCGKTTWAFQAGANIIRPFKTSCMFEDNIEGGIVETRKELLTKFFGDELKKRVISRNTGITAENFYERIKMIYDLKMNNREEFEYDTKLYDNYGNRIYKLEPTVYLLDSLALLMPGKYTDEDDLSGQMSATAAAKTNSAVFKRIIPMLKSANIILLIINHINQKVDINPMQRTKAQVGYLKQGETLPGGNAAIYLATNIIRVDDNSKLKADEGFYINGSLVDFTLVKSRTNRAGRSTTLVFDQDNGFDADLSMFLLLKEMGRIKGAGAYLYIGDRSDMKFAQKNLKDKLVESLEFRDVFMKEVVCALKEILSAEEAEERRSYNLDLTSSIIDQINDINVA